MARADAAAALPPDTREDGAATVEFVLLLPVFLLLFISTMESSIMLYRQVMLERAVDIASRQVRLDTRSDIGSDDLKEMICEEARILGDCERNLVVELQLVNTVTYAMPDFAQPCFNRATSTLTATPIYVASDRASQIMTLRACYSADPLLPTTGLGAQLVADGDAEGIRIIAATAFRVEPP
ncbi:TadE/TadG family type IV pilus assembly protein [Jannaschia formosa]|uniref:TadE/TadG family type IV pilus assembly protein n=1 Tax=Jannaschia formosa TaxID=2259592 RepID=UPI00142F70E9|nr:TadE/TadG family type IV pilus assembly protein [Jannaschia formosa]